MDEPLEVVVVEEVAEELRSSRSTSRPTTRRPGTSPSSSTHRARRAIRSESCTPMATPGLNAYRRSPGSTHGRATSSGARRDRARRVDLERPARPLVLWSRDAVHEPVSTSEQRFDLIERIGVTVLCQTPSEYRLMAKHPSLEGFYIGSVRHAVSTGSPSTGCSGHLPRCIRAPIYDGYGQPENTILVANAPDIEVRPDRWVSRPGPRRRGDRRRGAPSSRLARRAISR